MSDEPEAPKRKTPPRRKLAAPVKGDVPEAAVPAGGAPKRRRKPAPPPAPASKTSLWWAAGTALIVLALDQLTKWIVVRALNLMEVQAIDVIDPWLNLRMAWNQGMNFGLLASSQEFTRWLLIAVVASIGAVLKQRTISPAQLRARYA